MDDCGSRLVWVTQNENVLEVEEILTNILSRLPVKSLLICKSVCKYWRGLICSSSFKELHLIQSQENPSYVFYPYPASWDDNIRLLTKTDGETTQSFPDCDGSYFKGMICSFNGLICSINRTVCHSMRHCALGIYICNPATRRVSLLPPSPISKRLPDKIGVSFGPTINEYKVFHFLDIEEQLYACKVFSSITESWKFIGTVAYSPYTSSNHVCINETVYWFSKSRIDGVLLGHILAVDREENFSIIWIPEEETIRPFMVNFEGCLCLVAIADDENRFDVWALEDSEESIWVKKWSDQMPIPEINLLNYVAVRKNEILFGSFKQYFFYKMGTRTWREFNWEHRHECGFSLPLTYTESLLPCS